MTRVNKKNFDVKLKREAWQRFLSIASCSKSTDKLVDNLRSFVTPAEMTMIEKRLLIPILLERGFTYRAIGETIDVSANTISFVKNHMTRGPRTRRGSHYILPRRRGEEPSLFISPGEHTKRMRRKVGL